MTAIRSRSGSETPTTSIPDGGTSMTRRLLVSSAVTAAFLAATASIHAQGNGQPAQAAASKPTPRGADGHVDLSGVWVPGNRSIRTDHSTSIKVVLPLDGVDQDKDNVFAA